MRKILFILKYRTCDHYGTHLSSGLLNSANFVNDVLNKTGHVESSLVQVPDGNYVDREVYLKKPDIVVLEAYWVSPAKVLELTKLHPKVKWIVRSHSNLPFFATEANALKWTWEYLTVPNLTIAPNNLKLLDCLIKMTKHSSKIKHLPNYYPTKKDRCFHTRPSRYGVIDVGCFGALRPLKNQVNQAMAAMLYADNHRANLKFHINHSRSDGNGNSILLNLRSMFNPIFNPNHRLVEHDWVSHDDFMKLMTTMDIGMQVSYTETFNIVTADMVESGIPVVVSDDIDWVSKECHAHPNSVGGMCEAMDHVVRHSSKLIQENQHRLEKYSDNSLREWLKVLLEL